MYCVWFVQVDCIFFFQSRLEVGCVGVCFVGRSIDDEDEDAWFVCLSEIYMSIYSFSTQNPCCESPLSVVCSIFFFFLALMNKEVKFTD